MSTTRHVPNVSCHCATWTNHPHHLGNAACWIGNEENYQRHDGSIEPSFGERKRQRIALLRNCSVVRISGVSHWLHHEARDQYITELRAFLASHYPESPSHA